VRTGALGTAAAPLLPVRIVPEQTVSAVSRQRAAAGDATIEIALPDGTMVRVGRDVGAVALRRVLGALRG
jgi:hypothetical protein